MSTEVNSVINLIGFSNVNYRYFLDKKNLQMQIISLAVTFSPLQKSPKDINNLKDIMINIHLDIQFHNGIIIE